MLAFQKPFFVSNQSDFGLDLHNFWEPEGNFAWSTGRWCEIVFSFADVESGARSFDLMLDVNVFNDGERLVGQNILTYLNGLRIGSVFLKSRSVLVLPCDASILRKNDNILTFDTPDATSPAEFGEADTRVLGLQLFSVQLQKTS